ncbi:MAG: MmcQ/YjbR family DNA-binding protein, partial [Rhodobacteraceae bacterium]|nr:MmcQ/YjbR family DNA-binding protein [Paracoccaceae bacterium]
EVSDPWGGGHDVWKVGGKSYAIMGTQNEGVTLKCADSGTAQMLIEVGRAEKAPYLPRGGWVFIRFGAMESPELAERLRSSYLTVHRSLTKKLQATLDPFDCPLPKR